MLQREELLDACCTGKLVPCSNAPLTPSVFKFYYLGADALIARKHSVYSFSLTTLYLQECWPSGKKGGGRSRHGVGVRRKGWSTLCFHGNATASSLLVCLLLRKLRTVVRWGVRLSSLVSFLTPPLKGWAADKLKAHLHA